MSEDSFGAAKAAYYSVLERVRAGEYGLLEELSRRCGAYRAELRIKFTVDPMHAMGLGQRVLCEMEEILDSTSKTNAKILIDRIAEKSRNYPPPSAP